MNYLLFTTTRCPKCPAVKQFVSENVSFEGQILDETVPDFMVQAQEYGITAAPVFLVLDGGEEKFRGSEISEIEDFLNNL